MSANHHQSHEGNYYVPESSQWPIVGAIGLFSLAVGTISWLHADPASTYVPYVFIAGLLILLYMLFGWFGQVIQESRAGLNSAQMDRSYRMGMMWFIFSEVMFFACFFGALFYVRMFCGPWLAASTPYSAVTHILWPHFTFSWPLLQNPDPTLFVGASHGMGPWGLPAINTLILLTSGATVTWAHWALKNNKRQSLAIGLGLTVALGVVFLICQAYEYHHAYTELGLKLSAGIYGATFFMLTGFHGAHVTIGTIMLFVMLMRCLRGHFTPEQHFAFEATAWYWHFVDVVWLILFVFVYWL